MEDRIEKMITANSEESANNLHPEWFRKHREQFCLRLYKPREGDWFGETKKYLYRIRDGWRRVDMLKKACEYNEIVPFCDVDFETKLAKATKDMERVTKEVTEQISVLTDEKQQAVITLRYFKGRSWGEIAEELGMTKEEAIKLHQTALPILKRTIPQDHPDDQTSTS